MSSQAPAKTGTAARVGEYLKANQSKLEATIPKHVNAERLMRVAVQAIASTPSLAQCSYPSLVASIVRASMLGLEPNGPLGEAYLVPFNSKNNGKECQLILGYRGLINIARRSGEVTEVYAHCVYERDTFDMELGSSPRLVHKPFVTGDRGAMVGVYAFYVTTSAAKDFEYMTIAEVEKVRASSKAANSDAWTKWFDEMARKTVIRRLSKRMPMSVEMAMAVDLDNKVAMGERVDHADIVDVSGIEIPEMPAIEDGEDATRGAK